MPHPSSQPISGGERGFTLVETLITIAVFSVVVIGIGTIFVQVSAIQRRGFGAQKVQENALFVLESIAREIRVSTIPAGQNSDCVTTFADALAIIHPVNGAVSYFLTADGVVHRSVGGTSVAISSNDVKFTRLHFCGMGTSLDKKQARIAIIATVQNNTQGTRDKVQFDLQTTVASREVSSELQN